MFEMQCNVIFLLFFIHECIFSLRRNKREVYGFPHRMQQITVAFKIVFVCNNNGYSAYGYNCQISHMTISGAIPLTQQQLLAPVDDNGT